MYDTGDLATADADGVFTWAGRSDAQVKVRGYRIELGEIEVVLRAAEPVHDAVVLVAPSGSELWAAIVLKAGHGELDEDALSAALAERLPAYMVPARFAVLPDFPRNPNGKIDRKLVRGLLEEGEQ
jgi:mycobactin peptide synthetase MbtF